MSLVLRFAAGSHKGLIREGNEDSGYAGPRLLAVADGMGGAAAGEVASSEALSSLIALDEADPQADLLTLLNDAVQNANDRLRLMVEQDPQLEGMGCTLTALLWTGERMGLVHVGDSRAYLLRDGSLTQITQDHTWVQRLVDEGRITAEEAETHPQRSLLMRALDGRGQVEPDLAIREVRAGDRYLICSDGLSGPVSHQTLEETLGSFYAPEPTIQELIQLALRGGGPDNITCIVADVLDIGPNDTHSGQFTTTPVVVGAIAEGPHGTAVDNQIIDTPAGRAAGLGRQQPPQGAFGPADGYDGQAPGGFGPAEGYGADGYGGEGYGAEGYGPGDPQAPAGYPGGPEGGYGQAQSPEAQPAGAEQPPRKRRWFRRSAITVVALALVGGAAYAGYSWTQDKYYLGISDGHVTVYQGINENIAGISLSKVHSTTAVQTRLLPVESQNALKSTVAASSLEDANAKVSVYSHQADVCSKVAQQQPTDSQGQPVTAASYRSAPRVGAPVTPTPSAAPGQGSTGAGEPSAPPSSPTAVPSSPAADGSPSAPATPGGQSSLSAADQELQKSCPQPS
ncbi:protein phosphatase 2C domain-containing protein [Kitasatospora sp. RB6PN24]|uniref:protein phosphatase 2C domain-containing protein n=1 Tax=Kitasatospora humi TaxID=2893891 RepID=UPI001E56BE34|nr:protein phosphatase 2C domain-containing protein [Kitasatospora humi]MCC9308011.1 protein phosphatase 2C domain-containing protein [Kitasatospora humi]